MADKIDYGSVVYVLGILSIVFAFVSPVAGLIFGIIGINHSKKQGVSGSSRRLNIIGVVLSVVLLIISLIAIYYSVRNGLTDYTGISSIFPAA